MARQPTLVLTRPLVQSTRFAGQVRAKFGQVWKIVISPVTELRYLSPSIDQTGVTGLIFTSESAVAAYVRLSPRRDLQAWAVGPATAAAARRAGFSVCEGPGNARALSKLISQGGQGGKLLYIRGSHVAADLETELKSAGIETDSAIVYDQHAVSPTPDAVSAFAGGGPVLLPLFSVRAAQLTAAIMQERPAPLYISAISGTVAETARAMSSVVLDVSRSPDADGMLESLGIIAELSQRA